MVAFDGSESCQRAEAYYHDYLQDPRNPSVPQSVIAHIEECIYCQSRVRTLGEALCEVDSRDWSALLERDSQVIAELRSHFEYLDELLACAQVKPFLCSLVSPSMRIRIPTPITVHLDQCAPCADDLESLRQLDLGADQLVRLGRLFGESPQDVPRLCPRGQSHATAFATMSFEGIPSEILGHLCACPRCRRQVYEQRQEFLNRSQNTRVQASSPACENITTSRLFDYVIPYGLRPESFRGQPHRDLAEHLRRCPTCLERMQHIHCTISQIAERPDSDVATVYTGQGQEEVASGDILPTPYAAYPIDVHVVRSRRATRDNSAITGRLKRRMAGAAARPFARVAFLAAAMIPLAVVFILSMPAASALSIRQVDRALAKARTVHISVFGNDSTNPIQQFWISRSRELVISESGSVQRIFDLERRQATIVPSGTAPLEHMDLDRRDREALERLMRHYLESSLDNAPVDAELSHRSEDSGTTHAGLDVYELTWSRAAGAGVSIPRKLTIYIDPLSKLPLRQEFSSWVPAIEDWHVQTVLYEYPDEDEIEAHRQTLLSVK